MSEVPFAKVRIDVPVRHLDRDFDYRVPDSMSEVAQPGMRVRVRFAGRLVDGVIRARTSSAEVEKVAPIVKVVGTMPMLTRETMDMADAIAERYAGTFWDVVRTIVPPRHAAAEASLDAVASSDALSEISAPSTQQWARYGEGESLLARGGRVVWASAPASDMRSEIVELVLAYLSREPDTGVIVALPDATDVKDLKIALEKFLSPDVLAVLSTEAGPRERYRQFLRVMSGRARVVLGNRAAVAAPVQNLRLLVMWDDGDDTYAEPRAPYWDAREVAALRAHREGCDLWVGSPARTVATQYWCEQGWAHSLVALHPRALTVHALHAGLEREDPVAHAARIPHVALRVMRSALVKGPILVSVARPGYLPVIACQGCREPARCECGGPLSLSSGHAIPTCTWCGRLAGDWVCRECGSRQVRAISVGAERTAEEIGRAFPGVAVVFSQADHRIAHVTSEPRIVISTPGVEPRAEGGYSAVVILDAARVSAYLEASEQRLRRWFSAALHCQLGGDVVVAAPESDPAVQALVRWDSPWFAERELAERSETRLPPVTRWLTVTAAAPDVQEVLEGIRSVHIVRGPIPLDHERVRAVVIFPRHAATQVIAEVRGAVAVAKNPIRLQVDPRSL